MKNLRVVPIVLFFAALVGATSLLVAAGLAEPAPLQQSALPAR